jgi:hypothetical protein
MPTIPGQSSKNSGSKESDEADGEPADKKCDGIIEEDEDVEYEDENDLQEDYYTENPTQITTAIATVSQLFDINNDSQFLV